jgi:GTP-binding protein
MSERLLLKMHTFKLTILRSFTGKTTLVDQLLKASSTDSKEQTEDRLMDCGELERERGITITSKVTRCDYRDTIVNIVDTPGHADFCGEVDRILSLVDGVCLVVDAAEGPMAQTKYVLSRALNLGLRPMVVLNKVDRADGWSRIESGETESELLDLFDTLGADENQLDYLTLYASARDGWVTDDYDVAESIAHGKIDNQSNEEIGMKSLLDRILDTFQNQPCIAMMASIPQRMDPFLAKPSRTTDSPLRL